MGFSLTQLADEDLVGIYMFGFTLFGPAQADAYQDGLEAAFMLLGRHPQAARRVPELGAEVRAYRNRAHIILYEPLGDDILVLRVRSAREDWFAAPD